MNGQPLDRCDMDMLDALLCGTLSQEEAADVEAHLSGCRTCAERIQLAAVPETSWDEAQSLLSLDEFDGFSSLAAASSLFPSEADDHVDSPTKELLSREISGWLDPTDDPAMLGRFAGYEIVGIIGHGGMGIVLKGFERSLNRYVAIKILAPRLATNGSARKRFAREAQAAAAVRHDNVIAIHRVDEWHGLPFLTMPYVGGVSLQKRIDSEGPLSIEQTLRVGVQIAAGLAAAHAQGLVHRDIKPANILLEQGVERVTITDFGLARAADDASVTRTGVIAGTPQYMSPEQAEAQPLDARSDLFSLGSVMYVMATGRPPFRGEGSFDVLKRIVKEPTRSMREIEPGIPAWFEALVNRLHAKAPDERPQSAEAVAELLEDCLAHVQQPTTTPLPKSVAALANRNKLSQMNTLSGWAQVLRFVIPDGLRRTANNRRPPIRKLIAAAAFAFSLIFAGVLIVLELNKGTLTIESEADDVPIRIIQGDEVVKELTVSRTGKSTRIAAGQYVVEIDQSFDKAILRDNIVSISRGSAVTVTVTQVNKQSVMEVNGEISGSGHETNPSRDRSAFDVYLAEVEARQGKRFSEAERRAWRRHWLPRLLTALRETNDADQKRSVAISALGLSNALLEFDTSESLLRTLISLARDDKSAAAWQAELDGISERRRLRVPPSDGAAPTQDSVKPSVEGYLKADEASVQGTGKVVAFPPQELKEGEELSTIVPDTSERAVELWISGNDAPLVQRGDNVRLQFEGWPAVSGAGTFGGKVIAVDPTADGAGKFRILVKPDGNDSWPDKRYLRPGVRAIGWILPGDNSNTEARNESRPTAVSDSESDKSAFTLCGTCLGIADGRNWLHLATRCFGCLCNLYCRYACRGVPPAANALQPQPRLTNRDITKRSTGGNRVES